MILALGINHKTAPVALREKLAFAAHEIPEMLHVIKQQSQAQELALISTCNRTEFYCFNTTPDDLTLSWLTHKKADLDISPYLYHHSDTKAVHHLMRVAAGLDSMVVGEPQILSQLKTAYEMAQTYGSLGRHLQRLFQKTFMVAKMVRTQTAVGQYPVSVAYSAVKLARQIFSDIKKARVLLIGAGETIELVAQHLRTQGVHGICFANRTLERANTLCVEPNDQAIDIAQLPECIGDFDIVLSAVATSKPVLSADIVREGLKKRKRHPIFMVDLGIPRNIDPSLADHEDIYLYNLDDLRKVVDENVGSRNQEALLADAIIQQHAHLFMRWLDADCAHAVIRDSRAQAERIKAELVDKAMGELKAGHPPEKVIEYLAHRLTQKLLHSPSIRVKKAGDMQEESIIRAASEILHFE